MKCDCCPYRTGGIMPDAWEEEWWCKKGYGNPMTDEGCKHVFLFQIKDFLLRPYRRYVTARWLKKLTKESQGH